MYTATHKPPKPAGCLLKRLQELRELNDATGDGYFRLVNGAVSDNLGLRGVLEILEAFEALRAAAQATPLDHVRRIAIFVVNSVSTPSTKWNMSENPPVTFVILTKASGVPIDRYSSESVELPRDIDARWTAMREIRDAATLAKDTDPVLCRLVNMPNRDIFVVDVSFEALKDKAEWNYFIQLPTSFFLPDGAVDRLRAAAGRSSWNHQTFRKYYTTRALALSMGALQPTKKTNTEGHPESSNNIGIKQ